MCYNINSDGNVIMKNPDCGYTNNYNLQITHTESKQSFVHLPANNNNYYYSIIT